VVRFYGEGHRRAAAADAREDSGPSDLASIEAPRELTTEPEDDDPYYLGALPRVNGQSQPPRTAPSALQGE
jgi:hypothetical protein